MKFKYLLLFAASALLINPIPTVSAPLKLAYESRTAGSASTQVYQQANPAVVTVFAGQEIGSGSIVSADGLVLTNNHVVRGSAQVFVRMADGQRLSGQVIATDSRADLALIQLSGANSLPAIAFASSSPQAGQTVFAIGSPYGQPGVMTTGKFSRARSNGDLQSLVELHPGNSGGPLLNAQGQILGVNKAILESAGGSNTGISIATSAATARQFVEQNRPGGLVASSPSTVANRGNQTFDQSTANVPVEQAPTTRQYSGTTRIPQTSGSGRSRYSGNVVVIPQIGQGRTGSAPSYPLPSQRSNNTIGGQAGTYTARSSTGSRLGVRIDSRTLIIQQVEAGSAAANSGLQSGDRVVGVNGAQLNSLSDLQQFMQQAPSSAAFVVERQGRAETVMVQF